MTVVATSLTRHLLEHHLAAGPGRGRLPAPGAEAALRPDHAMMDARAATLVFQAFERCGATAATVDLALVCAETPPGAPMFEAAEELLYVRTAARRYGVHFSPPGNGRAHHVYAARHATPGRAVLTCAAAGAAAGALAALALPVSELEMAAALAGAPHDRRVPEVWAVRLSGALPPGVGAHDLLMAVSRALPGRGGRTVVLEFCGDGVAAVDQEGRFTVARLAAALGLPPVLFPADEHTRAWLRTQGREPDWKPLAGAPERDADRVVEVVLDGLEPSLVRAGGGADPLSAREVSGLAVRRVAVGADAGLADLLALAAPLAGRRVADGVELVVIPGSRQIRAALGAAGALAALAEAGARIVDDEARIAPGPAAGVALGCGASAALGRAATVFRVGPGLAAAAALAGRIADPRELPPPASSFPWPERFAPGESPVARPAPPSTPVEVMRGATIRPLPALPPLAATLRGVVLQRFPDRVGTDQVLPEGPRVWRHRGDAASLAAHLYAGLDRGFAARARALGGGFVVAGSEYGVGPRRPHVVLAMVALGVRVVIAESFAPDHRDELVLHGVLPLRPATDLDPVDLTVGDDLEIPGLPEMLEHNKPLIVRNLTRGCQIALRHDLAPREIERVRAGGLLAAAAPATVSP